MRGVLWTKAEDDFLIIARQQAKPMTYREIGKFLGKTENAVKSRLERMSVVPVAQGYDRIEAPEGCPDDFVKRLLEVHPEGYQDGPVKAVRRVHYSRETALPVLRSSMA